MEIPARVLAVLRKSDILPMHWREIRAAFAEIELVTVEEAAQVRWDAERIRARANGSRGRLMTVQEVVDAHIRETSAAHPQLGPREIGDLLGLAHRTLYRQYKRLGLPLQRDKPEGMRRAVRKGVRA